jgi:hypothetical protein
MRKSGLRRNASLSTYKGHATALSPTLLSDTANVTFFDIGVFESGNRVKLREASTYGPVAGCNLFSARLMAGLVGEMDKATSFKVTPSWKELRKSSESRDKKLPGPAPKTA